MRTAVCDAVTDVLQKGGKKGGYNRRCTSLNVEYGRNKIGHLADHISSWDLRDTVLRKMPVAGATVIPVPMRKSGVFSILVDSTAQESSGWPKTSHTHAP